MGKVYIVGGAEISGDYFDKKQRKDDVFVERSSREFLRFQKAKKRFDDFVFKHGVKKFNEQVGDGRKGKTVYNIPRNKRVIVRQKELIRMNDYAEQAKVIIDNRLKEFGKNLPEDVRDLFGLLKGMFLERKKLIFTEGIATFIKLENIQDENLRKAQELLKKGLDADKSRIYLYVEFKREDGSWG